MSGFDMYFSVLSLGIETKIIPGINYGVVVDFIKDGEVFYNCAYSVNGSLDTTTQPNKTISINENSKIFVRLSIESLEVATYPINWNADGMVKTSFFEHKFSLGIFEFSIRVRSKAYMTSSCFLKTASSEASILQKASKYKMTISNHLPQKNVDDCFFYADKDITLFAERIEREKQIPIFEQDEFEIEDFWEEIHDHYELEPVEVIEEDFPIGPIDPVDPWDVPYQDHEWDSLTDVLDSVDNPGLQFENDYSQLMQDEGTVVSVAGVSYIKEGDMAVAMNVVNEQIHMKSLNTNEITPFRTMKNNIFKKNVGLVVNEIDENNYGINLFYKTIKYEKFLFKTFCSKNTDKFIRTLSFEGIDGLQKRSSQEVCDTLNFKTEYLPNEYEVFLENGDIPTDCVDFEFGGAYSTYNWELFFHIPMSIAGKLSKDQKFEQAQKWYHYVFNPTSSESGDRERFWQFLPFYREASKEITTLNDLLMSGEEILKQIDLWEKKPFNPHVIARIRLSAYMKNVVMKYLDNLIAWADQLFMRDTLESINEATHLYILGAKILGPRPQKIPSLANPVEQTYSTLRDQNWLSLSNALVEIEQFIPDSKFGKYNIEKAFKNTANSMETMLYFGIIGNKKLLEYWDTISDRLFKIRHSMNIEGIERTLALFEPPIDPAMLVKAAASGIDIGSILNDISGVNKSNYRFSYVLQKAKQFVEEVKTLGHELLLAIEKRDSQALSILYRSNELKILEEIKEIKESNIKNAQRKLESVEKALAAAKERHEYFDSRPLTNENEDSHLESLDDALEDLDKQKVSETVAAVVAAIPDFKIGAPTSVGFTLGGTNLAKATMAFAAYYSAGVGENNIEGSKASVLGSYNRRMDDWKMQAKSSKKEIEQLEKEKLSSEIQIEIAKKELDIHKQQIENTKEIDEYYSQKFTNQDLYDWYIGEVSSVYFQSYKQAYEMAKKAQQCYMDELIEPDASFIGFGYWDSLKKGLLTGEKLSVDLNRMEASYMEKNSRKDMELTKHISLALLNPLALIDLKTKGKAVFTIPEILFDLDYPGHYRRRIKTISVTIPCVTGPYTTISCTLRLKKHYIRKELNTVSDNFYNISLDDYNRESIATSSAQNDSGLFEVSFRDERYLPFEGCGVVGEWELEMIDNVNLRQFDYNSISDVVLHMKYTSRDNPAVKNDVVTKINEELVNTASTMPLMSFVSCRNELPSEWYGFLHPQEGNDNIMDIPLNRNFFHYIARDRRIKIKSIRVHAAFKSDEPQNITLVYKKGDVVNEIEKDLIKLPGDVLHSAEIPIQGDLFFDELDSKAFNISIEEMDEGDINDLILSMEYMIE